MKRLLVPVLMVNALLLGVRAWQAFPIVEGGGTAAPILMTQAVEPPLPPFRRADANVDGAVDLSDAIATLSAIFLGVGEFVCEDAADSNDDGELDISDAINSLNYVFSGTAFIPAPGAESCGSDDTEDGLGCANYFLCPP